MATGYPLPSTDGMHGRCYPYMPTPACHSLLAENAMLKPALFLAALFAVSGLAEAVTPRSVHLDRKGDRIKQNRGRWQAMTPPLR